MLLKFGHKEWFVLVISIIFLTNLAIFLNIPFLRQTFGFLFLTFLPGLLILQILKLNEIEFTEKCVLAVGMSVSFLMFSGLILNIVSPYLGYTKPISTLPLTISISVAMLILSTILYKKNNFNFSIEINNKYINKFLSPILLVALIPLLGVIGALAVRFYENSIFSLLLMVVIALTVALIGFDLFIPSKLYPLAIFMIAIALILNRTLLSPYPFGSDIHYEYYFYKIVEMNAYWDPTTFPSNCNSMLSTVMLPTIYSILLKMDGVWVYKTVYPFIFSMVPIGIYQILKKQIAEKDAFMSVFFFMSFFSFFIVLSWLPRQQIAELFIILLVFLMMCKEIEPMKRSLLIIVCFASLIVSHYGITYIFLFCMLGVFALSFFIKTKNIILTQTMIALFIVMTIFWYTSISEGSVFNNIIHIIHHIYRSIGTELFSSNAIDPTISMAFGAGIFEAPFWIMMAQAWQILTQLILVFGLGHSILKYKESRFGREYFLLSSTFAILILMSIILPYFASSLNMNRIYHITLLLLSPFFVIGVETILKETSRLFKVVLLRSYKIKYLILLIILIPYFLFNNGFVFEITENPQNIHLNISHMDYKHVDAARFNYSYYIPFSTPEQDVFACRWLSSKIDNNLIYADKFRIHEPVGHGLISPMHMRRLNPATLNGKYIYLGYKNINEGIMEILDPEQVNTIITYNLTEITPKLEERKKIYANGGSEIYR